MSIFSKKPDNDDYFKENEDENTDIKFGSDDSNKTLPHHALTPDEITSAKSEFNPVKNSSPLDNLRKKVIKPLKDKTEDEHEKTLLERCMPYIVDENGNNAADEKPSYTLESVSEILKSENTKTIETVAKKYDLVFDDLGKSASITETSLAKPNEPEEDVEGELNVPILSEVQTNLPDISDIDNAVSHKETQEDTESEIEQTGTIRFTPVKEENNLRMSISSQTKPIDLTGELSQISLGEESPLETEMRLERTEFEEYIPEEEYASRDDAKRIYRKLSIKKRNSFLKVCTSIIATLFTACFLLPTLASLVLSNTAVCMAICSAFLLITILANFDIFIALPKLFKRHSSPDSTICLAVIAVICYTVTGFINSHSTLEIMILCETLLSLRAIGQFLYRSQMLSNFKQIVSSAPKRAIKLIDDPAVTFAMAKDAVLGDTLVAAPQRTEFISDFMKHSTFRTFLNGRLPVINIFAICLSLIIALLSFAYYTNSLQAFYSAAVILCITSAPTLFMIDSLPLYSAARKLNRRGAMIAGKMGAEKIEKANAIVLCSEDLFPSGTVTLHNIKVLNDNNIDDTLVKAASLTQALGSPLENIFKKIANTGNITTLPSSDTVKYEERMGISGWVDNKLLFVGNRTLMEAHGISVPSVETDRKILRKGYFPVYVATDGKACALLMVQYSVNPDVAHELRKLTGSGVTILVNNTDPNLSEEMICDYLGLYDDMVKVMSVAGCNMYKNTVRNENSTSAPAMYKGNPTGFASIINCAGKIKKANVVLTVLYILSAVLGVVLFAYKAFAGVGSLLSGGFVLLYCIISFIISYILYFTEKP
ncbi:MAG: cation-translocating P-type ATPase [Clostridia bacterium]|nr:cation-translocating P-type ATPase [Clostridia bacterium]